VERNARDLQEFLGVEARVLHADIVRQALDQAFREISGEFDAFAISPWRVVCKDRKRRRSPQPYDRIVDLFLRRTSHVRRNREHSVGANLLRVTGDVDRIFFRQRPEKDRNRHAPRNGFDRDLGAELAFGNGEIERFGFVVRPGDRRRAVAHVKLHHLLETGRIEAEVVFQRRDGGLHDPFQRKHHGDIPFA
jgi:hypothetical protein